MGDVSINKVETNKWVIGLIEQINKLIEKEDIKNTDKLSNLTPKHDENTVSIQQSNEEIDNLKKDIQQLMIKNRQIQNNDTPDIRSTKEKLQELYKKQKELTETEQRLKDATLQNQNGIFNINTQIRIMDKPLHVNTRDYTVQLSQLENKLSVLLKTNGELNEEKKKINKKKEEYDNFKTKITDLSERYKNKFTDYTDATKQLEYVRTQEERVDALTKRRRILNELNELYSNIITILSYISPSNAYVSDYKRNENNGNNEKNEIFKNKYLKYKMKYITLKKQFI